MTTETLDVEEGVDHSTGVSCSIQVTYSMKLYNKFGTVWVRWDQTSSRALYYGGVYVFKGEAPVPGQPMTGQAWGYNIPASFGDVNTGLPWGPGYTGAFGAASWNNDPVRVMCRTAATD